MAVSMRVKVLKVLSRPEVQHLQRPVALPKERDGLVMSRAWWPTLHSGHALESRRIATA